MEQKSRRLRLLAQLIAGMKKGGFETRPYLWTESGATMNQAWPFSRKRSASIAAMQPEPAAVIAWR